MVFDLIQQHTINTYDLTTKAYKVYRVPARMLLTSRRFDLFAKLAYVSEVQTSDSQDSYNIYYQHILAFNPDGREPGCDNKQSILDFVDDFKRLIISFKQHEFDEHISIIPVDSQGVILDGAHRVATAAYFDFNVTIAQFEQTQAKVDFDYIYFRNRGLSRGISDAIALKMTQWMPSLLAALFWPRMGKSHAKRHAIHYLKQRHHIAYCKTFKVNLSALTSLVARTYANQAWTDNHAAVRHKAMRCMGGDNRVWFLLFETNGTSIDDILCEKEELRTQFGADKDSLHITDNHDETLTLSRFALSDTEQWNPVRLQIFERFSDRWYIFKHVDWINFKTKIYNLIHGHLSL